MSMKTSDFDYDLPEELIAQEPAAVRDECRMLVLDRTTGHIEDRIFRDIEEYLNPGDLLVANETRVMPARLLGTKRDTGGAAEVFLLREVMDSTLADTGVNAAAQTDSAAPAAFQTDAAASATSQTDTDIPTNSNQTALWEVLVRPGKRLKPGTGAIVDIADAQGDVVLSAEVVDWASNTQKGERIARLYTPLPSLDEALHAAGHTPLPPYIKNYTGNEELYQTVYARRESSAAAPTAGLHFTPELIKRLRNKGVGWQTVELEVGLDTFRIVDEEDPTQHQMHTEFYTVDQQVIDAIEQTHAQGGRVIAVGTTSVRSLESAWDNTLDKLTPRNRETTSLYILPGYTFHVVDALITNFHVPRSTLMMLVSAFASRGMIMDAYRHAIDKGYRFFSFGDAMFIY